MSDPVIDSRAAAERADASDVLAGARERFLLPDGVLYLDGNSLGALPAAVPDAVADVVTREWGTDLIGSWNASGADGGGWWTLPTRLGDRIGALVGAAPGQVVCGDSTTVQLFQALVGLVRAQRRLPGPGRTTIVTDGANFPTDQYVAESVARLLDLRLVRVSPADVDSVLDDPALASDVACCSFSAVDYRTGELWDAAGITERVHAAGALMLWDLAHTVGAVPFELDAIGADAAVGCSYKYLNGGPGAPAWLYAAARHHDGLDLPLTGWQGHAEPFALTPNYRPAGGIERGRIGTPPVLSMSSLAAALDVFDAVPMADVRAKSLRLTDLVIGYADAHLPQVEVVTPREHARRGSQVALRLTEGAFEVTQALIARGVVGDFRTPDVLRLGFTPLYLRHVDAWDAMEVLRDVLETEAWREPRFAERGAVT